MSPKQTLICRMITIVKAVGASATLTVHLALAASRRSNPEALTKSTAVVCIVQTHVSTRKRRNSQVSSSARVPLANRIQIALRRAVMREFVAGAAVRTPVPSGSKSGTRRRTCAWATAAMMTAIAFSPMMARIRRARTMSAARNRCFTKTWVRAPCFSFESFWVYSPVAS